MNHNDIIYEKIEGIAKIVLNRPKSYNAFSMDMLNGWYKALVDAGNDKKVRVIVITGAGKSFCAGGDIKALAAGRGFLHLNNEDTIEELSPVEIREMLSGIIHRIPLTIGQLEKPVIAAINGPAMGAGLDMALACDIRIASEEAILSESYINLGITPGNGGAYFLPRLVGVAKALELLWTGDRISAAEALRIGLVNRVVPAHQLEEETLNLARQIARKSPQVVRFLKKLVYQGLNSNLESSLDLVASHTAIVAGSEEQKKVLLAFLEKRELVIKV